MRGRNILIKIAAVLLLLAFIGAAVAPAVLVSAATTSQELNQALDKQKKLPKRWMNWRISMNNLLNPRIS
jgi:predicted PurR-regulated permease PerM